MEKKKYCRNTSGISPKANSLKLKIQEAIKVYFFLFFFCNNGYVTRLMAERGVKPSSNHRTWSLHCIITHFPEHWESLTTVLLYKYCTTPYTLPPLKCFLACQLFTLSTITINSSYYMVVLPGSRTVTGRKECTFGKGAEHFETVIYLSQHLVSTFPPPPANLKSGVSFFNPVQWVSQSQVPFHKALEQATCSRGTP